MTFAEKMRELRDAIGMSEAKLADATGIPFGTLHNYAIGRRPPPFAAVVKIAKALGVDCTAFAACAGIGEEDVASTVEKPAPKKKGKK